MHARIQLPYLTHFHPSVSVNASNLLDHETMSGKPDLTLHTLSHFLDRFIYRTPKTSQGARGASIMQPLAGGDASDRLVTAGAGQAAAHAPLNSEAFWKKRADEVAAEDVFFHEYFNRVGKDKEKARVKKEGKDRVSRGDGGGEDGSDDESEIWKALVDSRPELEGAGDSDDDLDMDDLESAYDADEKDEDEDGQDGQEGSDGEGVIFDDESDPEEDEDMSEDVPAAKPKDTKATTKATKSKPSEEDDEDDDFDMDVSDEDAFVGSDEELPFGFEDLSDQEQEQEQDQDQDQGKGKGKDQGKKDEGEGKKKRKLKHLPTFASADDYAELLAGEDDGM